MAFIDSSSISNPVEQKWVVEITEILSDELKINVETPYVSIFKVPETITTKKPEAYMPQQIGLGPIHHFRPGPYQKMEQKKLSIVRKVLRDYKVVEDGKLVVLNKVRELVPIVRSCYDMFLQGNDHESLAMIFAIDGLFLLNLFGTYNSGMEKEKEEYLVFLKDRAKTLKQSIQYQTLYELAHENEIVEKMEFDVVNSENKTENTTESEIEESLEKHSNENEALLEVLPNPNPPRRQRKAYSKERDQQATTSQKEIMDESYDTFTLPPLLTQEEIVVTSENRSEWEHILRLPHHRVELPKVSPKKRSVAQDILMVENQIPYMVLKETDEALHFSLGNNSSQSPNNFSPSIIRTFCKVHSPLKLCSKSQAPTSIEHLLHYMYYSIVNNAQPDDPPSDDQSYKKKKEDGHKLFPSYLRDDISAVEQVYNLFTKIPQKEIIQAYEQTVSVLETFSQSKILIPSASKLRNKLGINFYSLIKHRGIKNIGIRRGKDMYLPCITLNNDSGVILRNLVAYETITSTSDSFPLTEYMGFMCALILNVEDVKLLRSGNVITGELGDDEVTKLFIELSSSIPTVKTKEKSKLKEMIDEINKVYESRLTMKAYLFLKKLARWLLVILKAIGGFAEASWKIVAFVASIVTVFILTSKAYCDVYGCDKQMVTLLPFASS